MANSIPISQIVKVNPSVLAAAGAAIDLNGLILTNSPAIPLNTVQAFSSAKDVATTFGNDSQEAKMATIYFNGYSIGTKQPALLYFAQYAGSTLPASLKGGSLASMTLAQLKAITGTLQVTVDGVVRGAAVTYNIANATSFTDAANGLSTILGVPVSYDVTASAFVISSPTTGAGSTITQASGAMATALKLTTATGATIFPAAASPAPSIPDFMNSILGLIQNWALFTTTYEPVLADKKAFSDWTSAQSLRFGYVGFDSDVAAKAAVDTTSWGAYLKETTLDGSIPIYGNNTHAAFVLGFAASLDFDRLNGRSTLAFKTQSGLVPSVTNSSDATNLENNGYNFYGAYASAKDNFNFMYAGKLSGTWKWLDTYLNQIWLNANLQYSMVKLLMNVGSIPYNTQGYTLVEAACLDPIYAAINFGAIRTGIALSESQKAQMQNALGVDASGAIQAKGFYLQIAPATAQQRIDRTSPSMTLYYTDGGSIQRLTLASIEVQ